MHGTWQCVELGVVLACGFAVPAGSGRKFVPEAIEVDALTPGDEALHVRASETEVPEQGVLEDLFPWPDARERRVDERKAHDTCGMQRGKGIADHVADIVRHEIGALNAQLVEDASHISSLSLLVEAVAGLGGESHSAQVRNHDRVSARQVDRHWRPHVASLAVTMK